ncbi:hypothetical protein ACQY0O_002530 [Thecaphora frezii]
MVKTGKLKRSERRQPEAFAIIPVDADSGPTTTNQDLHRPQQARSSQPSSKKATQRGKSSSKQARAKAQRAIENADKLAHRAQKNSLRAEKKKRAKA